MATTSWALILAGLMTTATIAQGPLRTAPATPDAAHDTKLLTGCLVAGPDDATFKLTNASPVPAPDAPRGEATASPVPTATSGEITEYELKAEARLDTASVAPVDLKQFVGHQVEITARPVAEAPAHEPARDGVQPQVAPEPAKPVEKKIERLTVTAIKQVLATCR